MVCQMNKYARYKYLLENAFPISEDSTTVVHCYFMHVICIIV
jgi:hypothetical protein